MRDLTKIQQFQSPLLEGTSSTVSSYPESEISYFRRRYGSDDLHQLHDGHMEEAILRYVKPHLRKQMMRLLNQLDNLPCLNSNEFKTPGRSAISLSQLQTNLDDYRSSGVRSLRWNEHYQQALDYVADLVANQMNVTRCKLKPIGYDEVAQSSAIQENLDKNAGSMAFVTGKRSKGENLEDALSWIDQNQVNILAKGNYNLPLIMSHRSSNSKPVTEDYDDKPEGWKWRCRIVLMQDIRALIMDGRFALPFNEALRKVDFSEGGMTHQQLESWVQIQRANSNYFFSSDFSKFDVSEAGWCIEDIFNRIVKPAFGKLDSIDEDRFRVMVNSFINKEIHGFNGPIFSSIGNVSGSFWTYPVNTLYHMVVKTTVLLMMGHDPGKFKSKLCGDDGLTYYKAPVEIDIKTFCDLTQRYFGIKTKIDDRDHGTVDVDPHFLSRYFTRNGCWRNIYEVVFNLLKPERYRDYTPSKTGVSIKRAEALMMYCAYLEQEAVIRHWFVTERIKTDSELMFNTRPELIYRKVASMGSGFNTQWIRWQLAEGFIPKLSA